LKLIRWSYKSYLVEATPALSELYAYMQEILPDTLGIKITEDLHISLTKTVVLKYHWINSFVEEVRGKLKPYRK